MSHLITNYTMFKDYLMLNEYDESTIKDLYSGEINQPEYKHLIEFKKDLDSAIYKYFRNDYKKIECYIEHAQIAFYKHDPRHLCLINNNKKIADMFIKTSNNKIWFY